MELNCPFHPTVRRIMSAGDETSLESHFCDTTCDASMPRCSHRCVEICHFDDRSHVDARKCRQQCQRHCSEGHRCSKTCDEVCSPCGWTDPAKTLLKCGHEIFAKCPTVGDPLLCQMSVVRMLSCGHEKSTTCSSTSTECDVLCDVALSCGHRCDVLCGRHEPGRHNVRCSKPCGKAKLGCRNPGSHSVCNKVYLLILSMGSDSR